VKRAVLLSPDAVRQLKALSAADRRRLREGLEAHLAKSDATLESRNRFRLRRPSPLAEYELRIGDLRAFYRVVEPQVQVVLIGRKERDALIIEGKRFIL
jgi:mRNA-degrading endonuclease RelE of RelBE toxin-antitoxin system